MCHEKNEKGPLTPPTSMEMQHPHYMTSCENQDQDRKAATSASAEMWLGLWEKNVAMEEAQVGCSQEQQLDPWEVAANTYCLSQEGSDTLNIHQNQWQQLATHSMQRQELSGIIAIPSLSIFGEDI